MSEPNSTPQSSQPAAARPPVKKRVWVGVQLLLAVLVAVAAIVFLLWPETHTREGAESASQEAEIVKLAGQHRLTIVPGTPLEQKVKIADVSRQRTSAPLLKVTGSVVARVRPQRRKSLRLRADGTLILPIWPALCRLAEGPQQRPLQ